MVTTEKKLAVDGGQTTTGGMTTSDLLGMLAKLVSVYGVRGLVIASRAYLGPASIAANRLAESEKTTGFAGFTPIEVALLGLALSKLAWEAGELSLHNANVSGDGQLPSWQLDAETQRPPALSLAHMIAIKRAWDARSAPSSSEMMTTKSYSAPAPLASARTMRLAARSTYYADARTSGGARMATTTTALTTSRPRTGGCGCGGAKTAPTPTTTPRTPLSDPCSPCGGVAQPPPAPTASCGCGCGGCSSCAPQTKTYDSSLCPTWTISCETKAALKDCVKQALCDFARCVTDTLCPGGRYDPKVLQSKDTRQELADCVGQLACSFLHCIPDALCPPDNCAPPQVPADCVPCGYAVEVLR